MAKLGRGIPSQRQTKYDIANVMEHLKMYTRLKTLHANDMLGILVVSVTLNKLAQSKQLNTGAI